MSTVGSIPVYVRGYVSTARGGGWNNGATEEDGKCFARTIASATPRHDYEGGERSHRQDRRGDPLNETWYYDAHARYASRRRQGTDQETILDSNPVYVGTTNYRDCGEGGENGGRSYAANSTYVVLNVFHEQYMLIIT